MTDYYNLLNHEWTLREGKVYRITVGINRDLPDGLEEKFAKMLKEVPNTRRNSPPVETKLETSVSSVPLIDKESLTIIIVPFNERSSFFHEIIMQLRETNFDPQKLKFIFVDNSTDESEKNYISKMIDILKKRFPLVKLIRNNNQKLLSGAMNKALEICDTELFIYLCSKHLYIYDNDWAKYLMSEMKAIGVREEKYIIGGTISNETGPHVQGGAFIAYTAPLKEIKYDAEKFPMIFMDVDLCRRIIKKGFKLKQIDGMLSKMSNYTLKDHSKNIETQQYKIVHSHEILKYRSNKLDETEKIKYSISLVCHNHVELTKKCLESVMKWAGKRKDFEILIVNNASEDGTKDYLEKFKIQHQNNLNIQILHSEQNQGFMTPQNYNAKLSCGKYLIVLNNDLEVCDKWIEKLEVPFINNNKMAITGLKQNPCTIDKNGRGVCGNDIEYIEMSCAMVRNDLVKKYGLFDDETLTFGYCEDTDFSLRLREKGFEIAVVDLPIKHNRSATMGKLTLDIRGHEAKNKYFVMQRWKHYFENKNFEYKILVKRRSAMGDVILTTGVLKRLREKYPLANITIKTDCPYVYLQNPYVNHIINYDNPINETKLFNMIFDLDMSYESDPQKHIIDVYSQKLGVSSEKDLHLFSIKEYEDKIKGIFDKKKIAVIHCEPTEGWIGREMPLDRFNFAIQYLKKKGFSILEVGLKHRLKSDIEFKNTNWEDLVSIIKNSKIFIGLDSGPWHIAQAFEIPSVVPFGMIEPKYRVNDFTNTFPIVVEWLNCRGCHHWQKPPRIFSSKCLREKHLCMEMITDEMVKIAIDKALKASDGHN
jgi:GT2 family glycosyltransferase/ADP-heptose:LPS heptosyltransferase